MIDYLFILRKYSLLISNNNDNFLCNTGPTAGNYEQRPLHQIAAAELQIQQQQPVWDNSGWSFGTNHQELEIAFDYALASLGARVLSTRQTNPISQLEAKLLGFTVYRGNSLDSLEDAPLQPLIIPGR